MSRHKEALDVLSYTAGVMDWSWIAVEVRRLGVRRALANAIVGRYGAGSFREALRFWHGQDCPQWVRDYYAALWLGVFRVIDKNWPVSRGCPTGRYVAWAMTRPAREQDACRRRVLAHFGMDAIDEHPASG